MNEQDEATLAFLNRMDQPSGCGDLKIGDLWALMGAAARDSLAWEKKAARVKGDTFNSRWTRDEHLRQAKSYQDIAGKLGTLVRSLEKGLGA